MIDDKDANTFRESYEAEVFEYIYKKLGSREDAKVLTQETLNSSCTGIGRVILGQAENPLAAILEHAQRRIDEFLRCAPLAIRLLERYGDDNEVTEMIRVIRKKKVDARQWLDIKTMIFDKVLSKKLSPRCQNIFIHRQIEGYSYAEIAEKLEISHEVIEMEIMRTLHAVRGAFTP